MDHIPVLNEGNLFAIFFATCGLGFIVSLHCIGMCGPLCFLVTKNKKTFYSYQLARLISYLFIANIMMFFGRVLFTNISENIGKYIVLVLLILFFILSIREVITKEKLNSKTLLYISQKALKSAKGSPFLLGLATSFLPCGILWSFIISLSVIENPLHGQLAVIGFWSGALPSFTFGKIAIEKMRSILRLKSNIPISIALGILPLFILIYRLLLVPSKSLAPFCH